MSVTSFLESFGSFLQNLTYPFQHPIDFLTNTTGNVVKSTFSWLLIPVLLIVFVFAFGGGKVF